MWARGTKLLITDIIVWAGETVILPALFLRCILLGRLLLHESVILQCKIKRCCETSMASSQEPKQVILSCTYCNNFTFGSIF